MKSPKALVEKDLLVTVDSPGIVTLKMKGGDIETISASDPSRNLYNVAG